MNYAEFLDEVIRRGIQGATEDYSGDASRIVAKRTGAVAGFESCRGKSPKELLLMLQEARKAAHPGIAEEDLDRYWYLRCYEAEVEWVCNVVSAMLLNEGMSTVVTPTARGVFLADKVLRGV